MKTYHFEVQFSAIFTVNALTEDQARNAVGQDAQHVTAEELNGDKLSLTPMEFILLHTEDDDA